MFGAVDGEAADLNALAPAWEKSWTVCWQVLSLRSAHHERRHVPTGNLTFRFLRVQKGQDLVQPLRAGCCNLRAESSQLGARGCKPESNFLPRFEAGVCSVIQRHQPIMVRTPKFASDGWQVQPVRIFGRVLCVCHCGGIDRSFVGAELGLATVFIDLRWRE